MTIWSGSQRPEATSTCCGSRCLCCSRTANDSHCEHITKLAQITAGCGCWGLLSGPDFRSSRSPVRPRVGRLREGYASTNAPLTELRTPAREHSSGRLAHKPNQRTQDHRKARSGGPSTFPPPNSRCQHSGRARQRSGPGPCRKHPQDGGGLLRFQLDIYGEITTEDGKTRRREGPPVACLSP